MTGRSNAMSGGTNNYELVAVGLTSRMTISYVSFEDDRLSAKEVSTTGNINVVKGSSMIITSTMITNPTLSGELEYYYNPGTDEHIILVNGNGTIRIGSN